MITVVQVIRALGIEPTSQLTWAVGNEVRNLYERRYGALPEKDLRPKTNGPGTHMHAVYPDDWHDTIADVVRHYRTEAVRQGDLFP